MTGDRFHIDERIADTLGRIYRGESTMTTTPREQDVARAREIVTATGVTHAAACTRRAKGSLNIPCDCGRQHLLDRIAEALATARAEGVEQSAAYVEAHDAIFANKHYAKVMAAAIRGTLLPTRRAEEESGRG